VIKYHIRLESRLSLDRSDDEAFLNRILQQINSCDYYKSIKRLTKDDIDVKLSENGGMVLSFDLVIYKAQNKTKVLDKFLSFSKNKLVRLHSLS
jgi:hypothetical protein